MCLLDEKTNETFTELDFMMENEGIKTIDLPPHITLGTYEGVELEELHDYVKDFVSKNESIELRFSHLGIFEDSVLFVEPKVTKELLQFHEDFHQKYDDLYSRNGYYYTLMSNAFVPHVSLALGNRDKILDALEIILDYFKPFNGFITELAIYEFYPIKKIYTFKLKNRRE